MAHDRTFACKFTAIAHEDDIVKICRGFPHPVGVCTLTAGFGQVKTDEDLHNVYEIQELIRLTAANSNPSLIVDDPIQFTLDTHDLTDQLI